MDLDFGLGLYKPSSKQIEDFSSKHNVSPCVVFTIFLTVYSTIGPVAASIVCFVWAKYGEKT